MKLFIALVLGAGLLIAGFGAGRATAPGPDFSQFSASDPSHSDPSHTALWRKFTDDLKTAGLHILTTYEREPEIDRAEGLRYLLQQTEAAIDAVLIRQSGEPALLRLGATTLKKWGLDSADAKYMGAAVDHEGTYRLYGTLGSARLFAIQLSTQIRPYEAYGEITGDRLQTDAAGNFELLIAHEKPASWTGNWLAMDPGSTDLLVREYYRDWQTETPGTYHLERLDAVAASEPLNLASLATLMDDAIAQFYLRAPQWQERSKQLIRFVANKVHMTHTEGGLAANFYGPGWFEVAQDEALLITVDPVPASMWSVQLGNYWWESIDYIGHTASYNDAQALADPDGKVRFVIAHKDPGVANWLDPAGHTEGMMLFRQLQAPELMKLDFELVKFDALEKHLPANAARATPDDRSIAYALRRAHAAKRWAP